MRKDIALKPRISEKSYALHELRGTYVFDVPSRINSLEIGKAVASQYGVKVASVRIATIPGKTKRTYRGRGRFTPGTRSDVRKAYVTLEKGEKLPIYQAVEEEVKAEKKAEKK